MARIAPEYIHEFLGQKFDSVRVYMLNGQCIIAQKPSMRREDSEAQKRNINRFSVASALATKLRPLYRDNYMPLAKRLANHNTPRSLFMKHLLEEVVEADPKTGKIIVHYDRIRYNPM